MSYQVLARKLRPAGFGALVGQEHVVRALAHALDHDRVHHAYLFTGTRGVGKTTIARILAKCLNCETNGVSSNPCLVCPTCIDVSEGRFLDLIEVDAASRTGVNDTRELLENAQYMPVRGRYKVYLIDEVHMLSNAAFNALLKTLEEPPPHVKFLLATTEVKKVPVTVLSRCLQFQLKNLSAERIAGYLETILVDEHVHAEKSALELIARAARGSMRDALSITDQAIAFGGGTLTATDVGEMLGIVGRDETGTLIQALASGSAERVLAITAELAERAVDFASLLAELASALHGMAVDCALGRNEMQVPLRADAVQLFYQIAIMGQRDLSLAPDPRSGVEMTLLRMLAFAPEPDSRVPRIEPAATPLSTSSDRGQLAVTTDPAVEPPQGMSTPHSNPAVAVAKRAADQPTADSRIQQPWHEMVEESDASGVTRMLMEHSVLVQRQGSNWLLHLDPRHDTLLVDSQRLAIARVLMPFGATEISVVVQSPAEETPAARKVRMQAEAQVTAEASVREDPVVQALIREFGGRIQQVVPVNEKARSRS